MTLNVPNTPRTPYYERRNNVKIAKDQSNRKFLDSSIGVHFTPPAKYRVEAETMSRDQGFVVRDNSNASNLLMIQAGDAGEQRASYIFDNATGVYDITIGHFDESDGQSSMTVYVNSVAKDTWTWSVDAGNASAHPTSFVGRVINNVALTPATWSSW